MPPSEPTPLALGEDDHTDDAVPDWLQPKKNKFICLPKDLLHSLKCDPVIAFEKSMINDPEETGMACDSLVRLYAYGEGVSYVHHVDSDGRTGDPELVEFRSEGQSTCLHFAAKLGDLPLVYECIRLGLDVDCRNVNGRTPLHFVAHEVSRCSLGLIAKQQTNDDTSETIAQLKRLRRIAGVLLEQHADFRLTPHGKPHSTPLYWAVHAMDMEMVELLILHGACDAITLYQLCYQVAQDSSSACAFHPERMPPLMDLVRRLERSGPSPRPPRQCPCWSGKLLSDCHGKGYHPYPSSFSCICGLSKTYEKCCKRRNFEILEKWDEERKRMRVVKRMHVDGSVYDWNPWRIFDVKNSPTEFEQFKKDRHLVAATIRVNDVAIEEKADPAFRYALSKNLVLLRPMGRLLTKNMCQQLSDRWNAYVDEYIALGTDYRSVLEIEQVAKLDVDFGPLWKRCDATGCEVVGRPGFKMKRCQGCEMIYYCNATCQKAHWKQHRAACKARNHPPQALRSQRIYTSIYDGIVKPMHESGVPLEYFDRL